MKHNVEFKNFSPPARVNEIVQSSIARLERHAPELRGDAASMRLMVEENAARTLYHVSLHIAVREHTLAAKEERHDLEDALHAAFAEIDRQLERHKETLKKSYLYKRPARREEVRRAKAGVAKPGRER